MQRTTPIFNLLDWKATSQTQNRLVYRPGLKVLFQRGLLATIMIAVASFGYYGAVATLSPASLNTKITEALERLDQDTAATIPAGVTAEEWERATAQQRQRLEQMHQRRFVVGARGLVAAQVALFIFIALMLLLPTSVLWSHVILSITPRRELEIRRRMLLPQRVSVNLLDLKRLLYGAQEIIHRTTTGQMTGHYWRWSVQLQCGDAGGGHTVAILYPCRQPNRPMKPQAPPEIAALIKWLSAHVQLQVSGPFLKEASFGRNRRPRVGETSFGPADAFPQFTEPRHVSRQQIPDSYTEHVAHHIQVVDEKGRTRRYDSRDALPEHIRRHFPPEGDLTTQGVLSERIVIRDKDGTETQYNSLDELPPDLRARFEEARNKQFEQ